MTANTDEPATAHEHRPPRQTEVVPPPPGGAFGVGGMTALLHSVHLISQATDALRHRLSQQLQINTVDVSALINIYNSPDIRPTDLGRSLHMGSAGLTALADRLVRAGLVDRRPHPADRRGYGLRLTRAGLDAAGWIFDSVALELTEHLDPAADPTAITSTLVEMSRVIERIDPGGRAAIG